MKFILLSFSLLLTIKNFNNSIIISISLIIIMSMKLSQTLLMFMFNEMIMLDYISSIMIILTISSTILIFISSQNFKEISLFISLIMIFLIMMFMMSSMMMFYILFEMIMIPTLILITKSGYQPERLQAGIYLFMYTIFASLPLLLMILNMKNNNNFMMNFTTCNNVKMPLIFLLAFLVKLPMFFFHLWLPKAHVEAPVEGSMILAAILLKMGGYGILRFYILMINSFNKFNFWIISLSMIGATATSFNCIQQKDLKSLIAYSSVAHMGFILASMMSFNYTSAMGSIIMMIGHGFSSSALFFLVNMIYSKFHTRNIISFKGLFNSFPNITFWWFIFMAINISAPPSINLISEILMMSSLIQWNFSLSLMIFLLSISTASFSIMMFINIIHNSNELLPSNQSFSKHYLSLFIHLSPLILLISKLELMS